MINDEDEDSNTALHLASLAGHNKVVSSLLDRGADIEARYVIIIYNSLLSRVSQNTSIVNTN